VPASSSGTLLTAITAGNTKAAWTQIVASTTNPLRWLLACFSGPVDEATWTSRTALIDIGFGAAASEVALISNIAGSWSTSESYTGNPILIPCQLPAGTRLAARYQADATSGAPTERPSVVLIGFD